jgi:UDP-glucose 4-epimerase
MCPNEAATTPHPTSIDFRPPGWHGYRSQAAAHGTPKTPVVSVSESAVREREEEYSAMTVLVTGGAGYVGSHVVKELQLAGIPCVVIDNLIHGHRDVVPGADLVVGDVGNVSLVGRVIREYRVDAVMHFAAFAYVGESISDPLKYYRNNVAATIGLLTAMAETGVRRLVFSSTCATYGMPETTPITESHPQRPINPYGATKLMVERILQDADAAYGLKSVVLRYFNAAGADPSGTIGEWHDPETHLIPLVLQAARRLRPRVEIYGDDYPTPDGTCVRDYIHVSDLAQAHLLGLRYLEAERPSDVFNLGNANGFSVRDVIAAVERITGLPVSSVVVPRRPGDPPTLVGNGDKARRILGWRPRLDRLDTIIETAWRWEQRRRAEGRRGEGSELDAATRSLTR